MKRAFFAFCLLLVSTMAMAQNKGSIVGILKDANTGEGVNGAVIELVDKATEKSNYYTTGYQGAFEIKGVAPATYIIKINFLGYKEHKTEVKVSNKQVNLGTIKFNQDALLVDKIDVKGFMGTSQKGDTVSYNASAFKTARDASAEGLLAKMPGINVNGDGTVEAQGESVQRIFVDGKEFFGEDVATTIKTIPAEMIAKVEVYDKLSDKAEFTGLDDGEGYKAINLVTKVGKRKGVFGKVYGSYGIPDKYSVGGNANIFNGDQKVSVIAMANNINQLNFSFEDIVGATSSGAVAQSGGGGGMRGMGMARNFMVRPMSGISTVQSVGVNYANQWDKLELQSSYFFNHTGNVNESSYDRTTYASDDYTEFSTHENQSESTNWNHRLNLRADYKFSKFQSLMLRASISLQDYESQSISNQMTADAKTGEELKKLQQTGNDERMGTYGNVFLLYRTRLGKPGRTITVNGGGNWNTSKSFNTPLYTFTIPADSTYYREIDRVAGSNRMRAEVTYTEPINETSQANLEYEFSHSFTDQEKLTSVWVNEELDEAQGLLLSNISESGYTIHKIGPGYNLSNDKVKLSLKLNYEYSTLSSKQILPEGAEPIYNFSNITYNGNATINFNKQNTLRVRFRSNTSNPSIRQLQDAIDVSGSSFTAGNPDLKPSYNHNLNLNYNLSDIMNGRSFMVYVGGSLHTRSIISAMQMNRPDFVIPDYNGQTLGVGNTYSVYENYSGWNNWNIYTGFNFGFPLKNIKSNLNFGLNAGLSQSPSKINDYLNVMNGQYYSGNMMVSSNISENLDFSISYNLSYNINDNVSELNTQLNKYFSQMARGDIKWIFWRGFTLTANASYNQYRGLTDDYNQEFLLCNAYIGKKVFKDQRGELSVGVNDIFDQNKDFNRSVGANYIQTSTNLAIGRYVAVQFVYNIRSFGKGSSSKDFDNLMGGPGGMGGPGPGGMGRHMGGGFHRR